jgi:predicted dehydrogenase
MIGAGGMGETWIRKILPSAADRLEIVGLVDVSEPALARSGEFLGLDPDQRFTDIERAFDSVEADCAIVVIPARFHAAAVVAAARHGVPVLCEKPLADTWAACVEMYRAVREARIKVEVVQNYRYYAPMRAMKRVLVDGRLGRLSYLVARFGDDCREYDSWRRRHEIPNAMLMDGAAHHFDTLRNLSDADCARMTALEWNPPWSSSQGQFNALCLMQMTSAARATYEGSATAAGEQYPWRYEYYRAECESGSITVDNQQAVRIHRSTRGHGVATEDVSVLTSEREGHDWIVSEFLDWLDGGPAPATTLEDNMQTAAMIFAAIESARTGETVDVQQMLRSAV